MSPTHQSDVLRGTLEMLVLKTLTLSPLHGWGIAQRIQERSRDAFRVGQGSLYPALQRLEQRGWVDSAWGMTAENRRAKYCRLTPPGRRALGAEVASWRHYVEAVDLVLGTGLRSEPCGG